MKNFFYTVVSLLALGILLASHSGPMARRAMAQAAAPAATVTTTTTVATATPAASAPVPTSGVTGDLVIDFMGAQRGYVEPCG